MSYELRKILKKSMIICLCEGSSEEGVMNMLLNNNKLVFSRDQLVRKKVHRRMSVRKVEDKFLNFDYGKTVVILRIIDSAREKFNLRKVYYMSKEHSI
jgi:hypothetical protein